MDDDVHVAQFVEEALDHEASRARQRAQGGAGGLEILHRLAGGLQRTAGNGGKPGNCVRVPGQTRLHAVEKFRDPPRKFRAAPRRFAEPERDGGRSPMRVLGVYLAGSDPLYTVGGVAELEYVPRQALERKVLVQRADAGLGGHQQHVVVELVRDGPAIGQGGDAGRPPRPQQPLHAVVMQVGAGAPAPRRVAVRQHPGHAGKALAIQFAVRPGQRKRCVQFIDAFLAAGPLGNDLLRQHVHGARWDADFLDFVPVRRLQ